MSTGRQRDAGAGAAHARAPAGSVSRALAASAVRLLEQDVDTGDPDTQRAVDDAVEAIAQRLTTLADACHGLPVRVDQAHRGGPLDPEGDPP